MPQCCSLALQSRGESSQGLADPKYLFLRRTNTVPDVLFWADCIVMSVEPDLKQDGGAESCAGKGAVGHASDDQSSENHL